jgi:hypothetical protein
MLKYLHDPILENKTKEVLFKIYSQVLPVGTNVEKFGYATTCSFCQQTEDEIHLFVTCPRISDLGYGFIIPFYVTIQHSSTTNCLLGKS